MIGETWGESSVSVVCVRVCAEDQEDDNPTRIDKYNDGPRSCTEIRHYQGPDIAYHPSPLSCGRKLASGSYRPLRRTE